MTNRETAEHAYDALARDDLDGLLGVLDPDVEFTSLIAEAEGRIYRGHEGVREWWSNVKPLMGGLEWDVEEIRELPADRVLVRITVTGRLGGAAIAQTMFQAVEGRGGKISWWGIFRTEVEALEALAARSK